MIAAIRPPRAHYEGIRPHLPVICPARAFRKTEDCGAGYGDSKSPLIACVGVAEPAAQPLSAAHRGKAPARVLPWDSTAAFWPLHLTPSGPRFVRATFGGAA